ncbi:aldehyde ferredoxin oxidoreductase family protein [[Eubacterium] cellulosolvens]
MESMYGYNGKIIRVDLSSPKITEEKIDESTYRNYLGGTGLGAYFLYKEVKPSVEWDAPENRMIFSTGPLNGTVVNGSGGYSIVTKGPLTNGATSVQANGFFGAFLKFCGYDGIIVQGASKEWVYLYIDEGHAELKDASHLKGKDTYQVEEQIKKEHGKKELDMSVLSIGPAGENLVRFAGVFSDFGHSASHNGPGAVMGSKKLKAIAAVRGKKKISINDSKELMRLSQEMLEKVKTVTKQIYDYGTLWAILAFDKNGMLPIKNYTTNTWSISDQIKEQFKPEEIIKKFAVRRHNCWACQLHHCHVFEIPEGERAGEIVEEPEYEQFAAWTTLIGNSDITSAVLLSKEVDRLGIDTNESGWLIAFLMECYEKGILTKDDLDGLEMTWGNVDATMKILNLIAQRKGVGDMLAEGVKRVAEKIGGEAPSIAVYTLKGNTPRGHDHRTRRWELVDTCVSNTGTMEINLPGTGADAENWEELALNEAKTKGYMQVEDSMVTCRFNTMGNVEFFANAIKAVTGWDITWEETAKIGRRIVNILRAFNLRHGITGDLDRPSPRYGSIPVDGPSKGSNITKYWDKMLRRYYREMGWDEETGKPLPETLKANGLDYVIADLWS